MVGAELGLMVHLFLSPFPWLPSGCWLRPGLACLTSPKEAEDRGKSTCSQSNAPSSLAQLLQL